MTSISKASTNIHYICGTSRNKVERYNKKSEIPSSSSACVEELSPAPEINIYQQYERQSSIANGIKGQVNTCRYIGNGILTEQQINALLNKYDFNNLDDTSTTAILNELADLGVITDEDKLIALDETAPCLIGGGDFIYNDNISVEKRRPTPNLSMEFILKDTGDIDTNLSKKIKYCSDKILWLSDEKNKGLNHFESENCQRLQQYSDSCEKVLNVLNVLRQFPS